MSRVVYCLLATIVFLSFVACMDANDIKSPDGSIDREPGSVAFMEECAPLSDDCAEGLVCFEFNSKGPHCTHSCETSSDCEEPSTGCNNKGVCKAP